MSVFILSHLKESSDVYIISITTTCSSSPYIFLHGNHDSIGIMDVVFCVCFGLR
eukprot:m.53469 g.53469  ORF g.53469 m.53469 type:complete len:54 (-) comp21767_c0_seq2:465-626(-)